MSNTIDHAQKSNGSQYINNTTMNLSKNIHNQPQDNYPVCSQFSTTENLEDLLKNYQLFKIIVDQHPSLILLLQLDGTIVYVNHSIRHLFGYQPESVIGTNIITYINSGNITTLKESINRDFFAHLCKLPNLKMIDLHQNHIHVKADYQELNFVQDTQLIMLSINCFFSEKNIQNKLEDLERINQDKDEFVNTVAHDLRAPLANMRMAVQMVKLAPNDERKQKYLDIIQGECNRQYDLINDLLDLQKLENKRICLVLESINLYSLLPKIIEPFLTRTQNYQQTLDLKFTGELPLLLSHKNSLERIITELLNNACKYTDPGKQIIMAVSGDRSQNANLLQISISNENEIPATQIDRIFDKFYRIPHSDRWKRGGTGLGLALVKKLVGELEATLTVESANGWTNFTVQIPIEPSAELINRSEKNLT
jgi:signal transduction histidine kinase